MDRHRIWFITGASSGFGQAIAMHALDDGDNVVACARGIEKLRELERRAPDRVLTLAMDVTDQGQVGKAVDAAIQRFGRVDVLVNNAGYGIGGAIEETPDKELRAQMETNFFGAMNVTRALLPIFRKQRAGTIVNMSSFGGQLSRPGFGAYSASKFALEGASEALAEELKPLGIRVLIVEPGAFRTGFSGDAFKFMPEIDDYAETVGKTREFVRQVDGKQPGDPRKAAQAIDTVLKSSEPPLRLQLGEDSVEAVRAHSTALLSDLNQWAEVALATRMDD
jgi:NAD(P)-dependent dehydrogenase (short-subunit alcohol dehydrogenase family)